MSAASDNQRTLESFGYKQELKRSVSTVDLLIYGLIFMVPIAPWAIFGTVYNSAAGMVPLVYVIGLVAMIFTALAYAQMAKSFPLAGSVFSYVGRGIHPSSVSRAYAFPCTRSMIHFSTRIFSPYPGHTYRP